MGKTTGIEWTDATWNPMTGCTKVSAGCKNCYAERVSLRFGDNFKYKFHPDRLAQVGKWGKPRRIFVCSMSDLFQEEATDEQIRQVFEAMGAGPHHTYQVLTKRIERAVVWANYRPGNLPWPTNVWLGTTVENMQAARDRIPVLLESKAPIKFLSVEPLLEQVSLAHWLKGIDWVIAGGESGPNNRPIKVEWARLVRDECRAAGVPFFFKQWSGFRPLSGGNLLDGKTWKQMPSE